MYEDACEKCNGPNIIWTVDDDIWNRALVGYGFKILCPMCFTQMARDAGIKILSWKLDPLISRS